MIRLPFKLPDDGLREFTGHLYLEEECIVIEVQPKFFGFIKEDKTVIEIEPGALADIRLKTGVFQDKLYLRPRSFRLFEVMPGEHKMDVELKVSKKYRSSVVAIVREVEARMAAAEAEADD